jgi:predicted Zn-dependent protease
MSHRVHGRINSGRQAIDFHYTAEVIPASETVTTLCGITMTSARSISEGNREREVCGTCRRHRETESAPVQQGEVVVMTIVSGGTVQQVTDVIGFDAERGMVQVRCTPDTTPRWVSLSKPRAGR